MVRQNPLHRPPNPNIGDMPKVPSQQILTLLNNGRSNVYRIRARCHGDGARDDEQVQVRQSQYPLIHGKKRHRSKKATSRRAPAFLRIFPRAVHHIYMAAQRNDPCPCGSGRKYKKCCAAAGASWQAHNNRGVSCQANGKLDDAAACFRLALLAEPNCSPAHHNLGLVYRQQGRLEEAGDSFGRAAATDPANAGAWYNLGLVRYSQRRMEEAAEAFRHAATYSPRSPEPYNNLGAALLDIGCVEESMANFARALELDPNYADAYSNLGAALKRLGRLEEAETCFRGAIALNPGSAQSQYNLGLACKNLGRREEAIESFSRALAVDPGHQAARYFLDALTGARTPSATPAELVADLFDGYADRFDAHLQEDLQYQTPKLLREEFGRFGVAGGLDILDLGCGTGLAGIAFRDMAASLTGVDLSPRMIQKAHQHGIYQDLRVEDVLTALRRERRRFDLVIAADVFVYIGDLEQVFAACGNALRPGGWFLFSIESADGGEYQLSPSGRFQHTRAYIEALAGRHAFAVKTRHPAALRLEGGQPVEGELFLLRADAPG
jgi:predicted TPR repeat methyltransferase